ncbi:MAG: SGNH/GDSL hydrolase family protein [Acetatifactor sp.]
MKKREGIRAIIYSVLAVLIFGILFLLTYRDRTAMEEQETPRIVVLGDSILGECRDETSIPAQLSKLLGEPVFNGALGGTCLSRQDKEKRMAYGKDSFSMAALAKSIIAGDFGVQQALRVNEPATEYFPSVIENLAEIDFDKVDILFIGHCLNDYHSGTQLAQEEAPYDEYTVEGALKSIITGLRKQYPHMRIILVTPTYTWYTAQGLTCEEYDTGGGFLEKYVEATLKTAEGLDVESIDLYHDFYSHEEWEDWQRYTKDGVHPNDMGRTMIAQRLAEYLQQ